MKKLTRKSILLFGAVLAVCAFAAPMASAASWAVVGTTHQLFAPDFSIRSNVVGVTDRVTCADTELHADVVSAAVLRITDGYFKNCIGTLGATNCTVTVTGTGFPWTATAVTTANIQIHDIRIDMFFENQPTGPTCAIPDSSFLVTGTVTGGSFDPSATGANRRITFVTAPGLTAHFPAGADQGPATLSGTFRDTTGTLNIFD